jgi:AP-1 complex subunit gamma-1
MARDVAPEVSALLGSKNSYVRKKAALCSVRILKKVPELSQQFVEGACNLLADRHHGVLLCAVTLALQLCAADEAAVTVFRTHVNTLVRILKSLIHSGYSAEHDVNGHADPFLQVKLLRLLRVLGAGDAEASDAMSDVLANVASNTDGSKNAGNAILYEAVGAIIGVESVGGLRVLAVNILGRFLANKDNNIRYVALNTLAKVVAVDTQAVQRHRATIVECVKDSDVTIRRSALQLVYNLVNENNITTLAKELLDYLSVADPEFKHDLTRRIARLVARFAPDRRWHIDTFVELLLKGGGYVADEEGRAFIQLVTATPDLQGYAGRALYRTASDTWRTHYQVAAVAAWVLGEYGDVVVARGNRVVNEAELVVSPRDVVSLLQSMLADVHSPAPVKQVAVTSLMKLSARFPEEVGAVQSAVSTVGASLNLELQQRASEFIKIFERGPGLSAPLLERMPPFELKGMDPGFNTERGGVGGGGHAVAAAAPDLLGDLMGLDDGFGGAVEGGGGDGAGGGASGVDLLGDLMMGTVDSSGPAAAGPAAAAFDPLAELFGIAPAPPATGGNSMMDMMGDDGGRGASASASAVVDPMMDLMGSLTMDPMGGGSTAALGEHAGATAAAAMGSIVAFQKDGLTVTFSCTKPDVANQPAATVVTARYINDASTAAVGFTLQAAVPKTMTLTLSPASAADVPPHGGVVTQILNVVNSQHGVKAIAMRLRLSWSWGAGGGAVTEQATVNFPPGM